MAPEPRSPAALQGDTPSRRHVRHPLGVPAGPPTVARPRAVPHDAQVGAPPSSVTPAWPPPGLHTVPVGGEGLPSAPTVGTTTPVEMGAGLGGEAVMSRSAVSGSLSQLPRLGRSGAQATLPRRQPPLDARVSAPQRATGAHDTLRLVSGGRGSSAAAGRAGPHGQGAQE